MKYFFPPYTPENVERIYKDLAKILHPDAGGTKETFQDLQKEKELALKLCKYYENSGSKNVPVKKIKMVRRKKPHPSKATNITFVIDPDKVTKLLKELKKFMR